MPTGMAATVEYRRQPSDEHSWIDAGEWAGSETPDGHLRWPAVLLRSIRERNIGRNSWPASALGRGRPKPGARNRTRSRKFSGYVLPAMVGVLSVDLGNRSRCRWRRDAGDRRSGPL